AFGVLGGLGLGGASPLVTVALVLLVGIPVAIQAIPRERWYEAEAWLVARPVVLQGIAVGAVIVAADAAVGQQGVAPFIYYRFCRVEPSADRDLTMPAGRVLGVLLIA